MALKFLGKVKLLNLLVLAICVVNVLGDGEILPASLRSDSDVDITNSVSETLSTNNAAAPVTLYAASSKGNILRDTDVRVRPDPALLLSDADVGITNSVSETLATNNAEAPVTLYSAGRNGNVIRERDWRPNQKPRPKPMPRQRQRPITPPRKPGGGGKGKSPPRNTPRNPPRPPPKHPGRNLQKNPSRPGSKSPGAYTEQLCKFLYA